MRIYTAHTRPERPPVLVREGFSPRAFVFGPFWLLANRAWIAAVLSLCAEAAIWLAAPMELRPPLGLASSWLTGLFGHDILRWSLERQGFLEAHVVAAADEDAALARLLERRPDLIPDALA